MTTNYVIVTTHAQERIRQRFGLSSIRAMRSWATAKIKDGKLVRTQPDGRLVYQWGDIELVTTPDSLNVITVMDLSQNKSYVVQFGSAILKEARKVLVKKEREFRKAEIKVAEITLNMLKARNPKIKAMLAEKLTIANDIKENIETEIKVIHKAAEQYGIEV